MKRKKSDPEINAQADPVIQQFLLAQARTYAPEAWADVERRLADPETRNKWRLQELEIKRKELELEKLSGNHDPKQMSLPIEDKLEPVLWKKDKRDLGEWLALAFDRGDIQASSRRQAVITAAPHFASVNEAGVPERVDGVSCWNNYCQKRDKDNGKVRA
jgi:hypothetical protein